MSDVTIKASTDKPYTQEIVAGPYSLISDVSKDLGGEELGPNPHQLLLSSLGSCTSITVQMYAKRKGWNLDKVRILLKEEKVADPDNPARTMPKIVREIELSGDLTAEQVEELTKIADKCPIHKLLVGPKEIATSVTKS